MLSPLVKLITLVGTVANLAPRASKSVDIPFTEPGGYPAVAIASVNNSIWECAIGRAMIDTNKTVRISVVNTWSATVATVQVTVQVLCIRSAVM